MCWSYAALITIVQGALQIYSILPSNWDIEKSLPFQLCDSAWMAAVVALVTRQAWASGLLYFWGLTLTSQALLTPFLERDFPHLEYIMFWFSHGAVVLAAIFVTWGLGFQPRWRHFAIRVAATYAWGFAMLAFNALAGTNYLYVSEKPPGKSILDALGPWSWYVVAESTILFVVWALMTWPWTRKRR